MSKTIIIIPSRLAAKRLPQKPLMEINGIPMIVQTYRRALESNCGDVYVASSDDDILNVIKNFVTKGRNRQDKALGAYYVLGSLTLVSHNAAISLPWLYETFRYN